MTQTVLIAGGTRMFGSKVARVFLDQAVHLRLLIRPYSDNANETKVSGELTGAGAETIKGDLTDPASFDRAIRDVDVIVSTVQGGPQIIVDGQAALARAYGADRFADHPSAHPPDGALADLFAIQHRHAETRCTKPIPVYRWGCGWSGQTRSGAWASSICRCAAGSCIWWRWWTGIPG